MLPLGSLNQLIEMERFKGKRRRSYARYGFTRKQVSRNHRDKRVAAKLLSETGVLKSGREEGTSGGILS